MTAKHSYQQWVSLSFLGLAFIAFMLMGRVTELFWDLFRLPFPSEWPLTPPELVGLLSAAVLFMVLRRNETTNTFMNEAAVELSKVTWPAQKETVMATGVIMLVIAFFSLALALYDVVWAWAVRLLY